MVVLSRKTLRAQLHHEKPASVAHLDARFNWRPGLGFNTRRDRQHSLEEIDLKYFLWSFSPFC